MSIAVCNYQHDVLPRIPVIGNDIVRYDSDNRTNTFSSSNVTVCTNSLVQSRSQTFHHPCTAVMNVSGCDQSSMYRICPVSFQLGQPLLIQVNGPLHLNQPTSNVSCVYNMISRPSHKPNRCRSVQLFIKSIRNKTISIHIDSTSSISDLKHLIYAHDGIPPCDLRLVHRGRELRDDALLSGLDVDGATITCLLRVLGGNTRRPMIPLYWWFGFSRSYEDGRAGEEGRTCHVLSEIEFGGPCLDRWYSAAPLSDWEGITLHSGICVYHYNVSR